MIKSKRLSKVVGGVSVLHRSDDGTGKDVSFESLNLLEDYSAVRLIESIGPVSSQSIPRDRMRSSFRFWQQVIEIAREMPKDQAIKIKLHDRNSYERVRSGLYKAARKLGVGITISRDVKTVYIERVIHVEKVIHSAP